MLSVVYCRVSTKEQAETGLSLDHQQAACREFCERQGWVVDRVFVERGESAKTADRPALRQMLNYCSQGQGRIERAVVYRLDRLARATHDHLVLKSALASSGVRLVSASEPLEDTGVGRFVETMLAAVAELDNSVRSERVTAGMRTAAGRGRWPFFAPLGYLNSRNETGVAVLVADPVAGPLVRMAFDVVAAGASIEEARSRVRALGLKGRRGGDITIQTMSRLLRNPIYVGRIRMDGWGVNSTGAFQPLVSEETFSLAQAVLDGRSRLGETHVSVRDDFPLKGFVRCVCGKRLTASWVRGRSRRYAYYHCRGCRRATKKVVLEDAWRGLLETLTPEPGHVRLLRAVLLDRWSERRKEARARVMQIENRINELERRRERLVEAYVHGGEIPRDIYTRHMSKLDAERSLLVLERQDAEGEQWDADGLLGFAEHLVMNARRMWDEAPVGYKQKFQRFVVPTGLEWDGERFGTVLTGWFYSQLRADFATGQRMVDLTGVEPATS